WIRFQRRRNLVVASAAALADGSKVPVGVSSPMLIKIYDREVFEDAFDLGKQMFLGQTARESMIVLVDCANRKVIPNDGEASDCGIARIVKPRTIQSSQRLDRASTIRIGCSVRLSGFNIRPSVSSVTAPSKASSSVSPSTTGDVARRPSISKVHSLTPRVSVLPSASTNSSSRPGLRPSVIQSLRRSTEYMAPESIKNRMRLAR